MKSRYYSNRKSIKKAVEQEWKTKEAEYYEICKQDIAPQLLAVCMLTLKTRFGFGKKRMTDFYTDVCGTFNIMNTGGILGTKFTPVDCIETIKKEYGIDLDRRD